VWLTTTAPAGCLTDVDALLSADAIRFANQVRAWIEVEDGCICGQGMTGGGRLGSTTVRLRRAGLTFGAELCEAERMVDHDLASLTREDLVQEVMRLREGIRRHRDSTGHELCWHHPQLWGLLPEKTDPLPAVPEWPQFLRGCIRYRQSLDDQLPSAPRSTGEYDT
jgi:hypothetical protein